LPVLTPVRSFVVRAGRRLTASPRLSLLGAIAAAAAASLVALGSARPVSAQAAPWVSPYPLRLTPARAAALVDAARQGVPYVPGEVVVRFRDGLSPGRQQRALSSLRSRPSVSSLRWLRSGAAVLHDDSQPDAVQLADQLRRQIEVVYAEPNYLYRTSAEPDDPGFAEHQWNFDAIDVPRAWEINPGGTDSLTVAVLDTGITTVDQTLTFPIANGSTIGSIAVPFKTNPDLSASRLVSPVDLLFWDGPVLDMVGHGTHVASTIGEDTNNNLAEAGIAYNVNIMPVKVCIGYWEAKFLLAADGQTDEVPADLSLCPDDAIADGIRYAADNGAKVINLSLGGPGESENLRDALEYAVQKGAFVAMAAGNDYEDGDPIEYPAAYGNDVMGAMTVGAVGPTLERAFYSGTASQVEIAAPGGDDRKGGAAGMIWQSTLFGSDFVPGRTLNPRFDRYAETPYEGTSMATPHVAAVAALLMSQGITNPAAVELTLRRTARDLGPAGRDADYGYGLVQPRLGLRGFGFLR
jgi:serine protease